MSILTQRSMKDCTIQIHDEPFAWVCTVHETGEQAATEEEAREGARTHIEGHTQ